MAVSLTDYVKALFVAEGDVLAQIRARHAAAGLPEIHVSSEEGQLLYVLLTAVGAARVLEVGSLGGYSGVWLARALPPEGSLTTVEIDAERAALAAEAYREAGVADRCTVLCGDGRTILPTLRPPFDAVFLDADKEGMPVYYEEAMRLLRPGGLLLGDNAFWGGAVVRDEDASPGTVAMREFNRRAASDPRLAATILPIRDGLLVGVKREPE